MSSRSFMVLFQGARPGAQPSLTADGLHWQHRPFRVARNPAPEPRTSLLSGESRPSAEYAVPPAARGPIGRSPRFQVLASSFMEVEVRLGCCEIQFASASAGYRTAPPSLM